MSRQREKDLDDTINQILEDMETMRNYILHLEETVTAVASEATRNTKHIQDNADEIINVNTSTHQLIDNNKKDIENNRLSIEDNKIEIEDNKREIENNLQSITELSLYGQWCAYQHQWSSSSTITYNSMFHTNTNMETSVTVLNSGTGKNVYFPSTSIAIILFTGIFTAPLAGTWSISFSLSSSPDPEDYNAIFLYKNGRQISETRHYTGNHVGSGYVGFTGGRNVFLSLDAGDTVELRASSHGEGTDRILICYEYVSK